MKTQNETKVTLELAEESSLPDFRKKLQEAFAIAVMETFGDCGDGPIPSDKDVQESFDAPGAIVYHILQNGKKVGGAVIRLESKTHHNSLDLFYIYPENHSKGIGLSAWKAIEAQHPDTVLWETVTPYFEKRNIHFYVNKCGFQIVEFYNEYHSDPHMNLNGRKDDKSLPSGNEFFRFKKVMK